MKLLIDSHVHIYPGYSASRLAEVFQARIQKAQADAGILMLAEREGVDVFSQWAQGQGPESYKPIRSDSTTLVLTKPNTPPILVVSGRQIACQERIEVLALATRSTFSDHQPIHETLRQVQQAQAVPVLAWGVGKWLLKRAKVVQSILATFDATSEICLGDSSLRPCFWPTPKPMRATHTHRPRVLAGSDPLPNPHEVERVGQYGNLVLCDSFNLEAPLTPQIIALLRTAPLARAGHRASCTQFLRRMLGR